MRHRRWLNRAIGAVCATGQRGSSGHLLGRILHGRLSELSAPTLDPPPALVHRQIVNATGVVVLDHHTGRVLELRVLGKRYARHQTIESTLARS